MKKSSVQRVVGFLCVVLLVFTIYTAAVEPKNTAFCQVGAEGVPTCDIVQGSRYAEIFGMRVVDFGVLSFIILNVAFFVQFFKPKNKSALKVFSYICYLGGAFALYFISLQAFVIGAWCQTCLVIDGTMILIALIVYFGLNTKGRR